MRVAPTAWISPELRHRITDIDPRVELTDLDDTLRPTDTRRIVPQTFDRDPAALRRYEEALIAADVWFGIPVIEVAARLIPHAAKLRWVHTVPAGGGSLVKALKLSPEELGRVQFTTSAGAHGTALAEFALFGLLAAAKDLPELRRRQQARHWGEQWVMRPLHEQTVLVLGLGGIGSEVARLLHALGCRVLGVRRHPKPTPGCDEVHGLGALPGLIHRADAVVCTLPLTDATEHLLNAQLLTLARPGLVVVNVGRGPVIEESALIDGLQDGRVGFACLDVTEHEPLAQDSPLWQLDNVLLSPHTASLRPDLETKVLAIFTDNLGRLLRGEPMRNTVDLHEFY